MSSSMREKFDPTDYRRDVPVGWVLKGQMFPGSPDYKVEAEAGKVLTVKDLCDGEDFPSEARLLQFRDFIKFDPSWITSESMGAPFSGSDAMSMLQAYAAGKSQDVDNCLMQLVIERNATDIYNKRLRECRPKSDATIDRSKDNLLEALKVIYPGFADLSLEERAKKVAEFLAK